MFKTLRYRDTGHRLGELKLRSRRVVELPGYPNGFDDRGLCMEFSHGDLWRMMDGWRVFDDSYLLRYVELRDLTDRQKDLYGLRDRDSTTVVRAAGLLDGETAPNAIVVPTALLEDAVEEPHDAERVRAEMTQRRAVTDAAWERFWADYYRDSGPVDTGAVFSRAVDTTDYNSVCGILVEGDCNAAWAVKCDGHAIRYVTLRGLLLDPSVIEWSSNAWITARDLLGEDITVNAALGGHLHTDLLNAALPAGWRVCERYAVLAVEAFVPVEHEDGRVGALVWPNSD